MLDDPLSFSKWDMTVLDPVVEAFVRAVLDLGHDLLLGRPVGAQLVGDDALGCHALLLEQPVQKSLCGLGVAAGLHDFIQNLAILVDRPPEPMFLARNVDDDLVQMPDVISAGRSAAEPASIVRAELLAPTPDRLVGHDDTALQQHLFDQAQARWKPKAQPHSTSDDLSWIAMALVAHSGCHPRPDSPSYFNRS
jgi:hypothetical protein